MKNLVNCLLDFFVKLFAKCQMLKWVGCAGRGGGGQMELTNKNESRKDFGFSMLFVKIFYSFSFFTFRLYISRTSCGDCDYRNINRTSVTCCSSCP
ncbi:MAG: hypothetical protein LBE18_04205 [Planctomycetaceae bacterium]|nr:hypothetical protein [Planctomycetaceae bacterium]